MAFVAQTIVDGSRNVVRNLTGAAGDAGVAIDVAVLRPSCTRVNIDQIFFAVPTTATVTLAWEATVNATILTLDGHDAYMDFRTFGGLTNTNVPGATGNIIVTSSGTTNWTIILHCTKHGIINRNNV